MASSDQYTNGNPGGLINPKHSKPKERRMTWTAENDRKLLLLGLGREISPKEYAAIANMFPEKPTPKAIQERLTKLRHDQKVALARMGLGAPSTIIHEALDASEDGSSTTSPKSGSTPPVVTSGNISAAKGLSKLSSSSFTMPNLPRKRRREPSEESSFVTDSFQPVNRLPPTSSNKKARIDKAPNASKADKSKTSTTSTTKKPEKTKGKAKQASTIPLPEDELIPLEILVNAHRLGKDYMRRKALMKQHQKAQTEGDELQAEAATDNNVEDAEAEADIVEDGNEGEGDGNGRAEGDDAAETLLGQVEDAGE